MVAATFLTLLLGAGVRSTPGILMVPFETEFHWTRNTISFVAISVSLDSGGLDDRPPFLDFRLLQCAKGLRRLLIARWKLPAQITKPHPHALIG